MQQSTTMEENGGSLVGVVGVAGGSGAGFDVSAPSYEQPLSYSYDEVFPALPDSAQPSAAYASLGQWNSKMRVGSSEITQILKIPARERRYDQNDFGEKESLRTCKSITQDTNATIEMTVTKDQGLTFLVTGRHEHVLEARRKILQQFQMQANGQITIPKAHHKWILGKLGQRLKDLERETETKISVPSMLDPSETISVTGTKEGIERAINKIRTISEEQSKKAFERFTVPRIYHPFIQGPQNSYLSQLMAETRTKITFLPQSVAKDEITISGDKEGVTAAKDRIMTTYKDMEQKAQTLCVEVKKTQHKYVIGPKGSGLAEILERTGVSVEMPPTDADASATVLLRGPQEKLCNALSLVYEKANSMTTQYIDVPCWIHRHLIGRKGDDIRKLRELCPRVHVDFVDKEDKIKLEGRTEEVKIVEEKLLSKANELKSLLMFKDIPVDSKFFKHIIGKNGANINRLKEQTDTSIAISSLDDGSGQIRIEGSKAAVAEAHKELQDMIYKLENETEADVSIEHRYHSSIIGQKGEKIREILEMFNQEVNIMFPNANEKKDVVKVRGPKVDVDKCCRYLKSLVRELAENSYVLEVPVFKQYHKLVIGKGGANIRKIKDDTHTKIDLPAEGEKSDVITITGKKEMVEEARDRILKIQNEQANIASEEVSVPMNLIQNRGKLLRSITNECGGVTIRLPQPGSHTDKVLVRGPKEDVERAVQQLKELAVELQESSFTAEVRAKPQHHRFLIGKNGCNVKRIRETTGCRIIFPTDQDEDQELITIIGKKESVKQAKTELEAAIKDIDNIVEEEMVVDPRHYKHFMIKRSGISTVQRIIDDCGGISISFPRQGSNSNRVSLRGSHDCIEAAKARIADIVDDLENQVTIEVVIAREHHRHLTGSKHIKIQELNATYNVTIKFPDRERLDESGYNNNNNSGGVQHNADYNQHGDNQLLANDSLNHQQQPSVDGDQQPMMNGDSGMPKPSEIITITGKLEKCEQAKQALLDSIPVTETMDVPFDYHRSIIGYKGQTIRDLSNRFDVHINVPPSSDRQDTIKVTGSRASIAMAKEAILDKMGEIDAENEDRKKKSFEVKLTVSQDYFPKIIGKKGAVINKIREEHGVQVNLPSRGSDEENTITIFGYQEKAEAARDDIMKIVNELDSMIKEEVSLDARVHSRLIGARGRSIRKVMDIYKVEIKFARPDDPNPDCVIIAGLEDDVREAKNHLLELQDEYMQEISEYEYRESFRPNHNEEGSNPFANLGSPAAGNNANNSHGGGGGGGGGGQGGGRDSGPGSGFVVKGAPWQKKAPDTASTEDFPSFGGGPAVGHTAPTQPWGPRR